MKPIYYNIVVCEMIGNMITKFKMISMDSMMPYVSTQMIEIVDKYGYYLNRLAINEFITIYTISIRTDYDIMKSDIRIEIKEKYKYELRLRKLKQLKKS